VTNRHLLGLIEAAQLPCSGAADSSVIHPYDDAMPDVTRVSSDGGEGDTSAAAEHVPRAWIGMGAECESSGAGSSSLGGEGRQGTGQHLGSCKRARKVGQQGEAQTWVSGVLAGLDWALKAGYAGWGEPAIVCCTM